MLPSLLGKSVVVKSEGGGFAALTPGNAALPTLQSTGPGTNSDTHGCLFKLMSLSETCIAVE